MRVGIGISMSGQRPSSGGAPAAPILDSLTAGAAYSTRKLRTAYAGAALRVRRSSDNVEADIGFSGNALDTTALSSFIGANSGFVVTWYDQSGNARHVTNATAANQPRIVNAGTIETRNSKPSLFFNGTSHHLFNSSPFMYANGSASIYAVYSAAAVAATRIVCEGNSANTVTSYGLQAKNTTSSAGIFTRTDAGVETVNLLDVPNIPSAFDSTFKQIAIRDSSTAIDGFLNGTAAPAQATSYTRSGTLTLDRFVIGAYLRSAAAGFLSGYISEVICFPAFHTNAELNAVGASQGGEYGISVVPFLTPVERLAQINGTGDGGSSLAVNLGGGGDEFDPIYLDRARGARRWLNGSNFNSVPDANITPERWLSSLPGGETQVRFFFSSYSRNSPSKITQGPDYSGRFQFKFIQGGGTPAFSDAGTNATQIDANTWEFDCDWNGNKWVQITPTSFPLQVSLIKVSDVSAVAGGAVFTTDYKDQFVTNSTVRCLNMFETNAPSSGLTAFTDRSSWSNWPQLNWQNGRPLAPMVAIFNEKMTSPWFCVHHNADDNHITQLATYLRDNLNPALKIRFELSNELWNTGTFSQGAYFKGLAETVWGVADGYANSRWLHYAGKRFVQMMNIINGVFAGQTHRVIGVIGGQAAGTSSAVAQLDASSWQTFEPGSYVAPHTRAKELTIAPYINYTGVKATTAQAIKDQLDISVTAAANYIKGTMTTAGLAQAKGWIDNHVPIASSRGLRLTMYEYNNHFDLFYYEGTVLYSTPGNPVAGALDAFIQATHSQEMADAQDELRAYAKAQGVSLMAFFQDLGPATRFGTWGAKAHHQHNSVIWNDLVAWHTANPRWWAQ